MKVVKSVLSLVPHCARSLKTRRISKTQAQIFCLRFLCCSRPRRAQLLDFPHQMSMIGLWAFQKLQRLITLKSLIIVQHISSIFGIFTYLHGLIRDCTFIYFGKKFCLHGYWRQIFSDFLTIFCFKALLLQ